MKKLFTLVAVAAMAVTSVAQAEMQLSGNVTTLVGYQRDDSALGGVSGTGGLTQGDLTWANVASGDHFGFAVPQAELDIENEFGENIRARIDVDFIDLGEPSATAVLLEQAYVTANLGVGNGMEFLIGKFNCPMGLESVDRNDNVFVTYTPGFVYLQPAQVLGARFYYEFNDTWYTTLAIVNAMNDPLGGGTSALPSAMWHFGAKWGEEGNQSNVNITGSFGPELIASNNAHYDMLGDMWGVFALGDAWDLGFELTYRQTNGIGGLNNTKGMAGQLYAMYEASDVWTVQFRGGWFDEVNAAGTDNGASTTGAGWSGVAGANPKGNDFNGTLGATYTITDGAKLNFEYRMDWYMTSGATTNPMFHTGVAEFAYSF